METRTTAERTAAILRRCAKIRARRIRRRMVLSYALCLCIVVGLGCYVAALPFSGAVLTPENGEFAGITMDTAGGGCVTVGVLSFLLGVCVTVLAIRYRRRQEKGKRNGD